MNDDTESEQIALGEVKPFNGTSHILKGRGTCAGCDFSAKEGNDRVCRYEPAKVFGFLVPIMVPGLRGPQQAAEFKSWTQFPVMADGQWCGRFKPREQR